MAGHSVESKHASVASTIVHALLLTGGYQGRSMRTLAYGVELTDIRLPHQPKRKPVHDSPQPSNVRLPRLGPPCLCRAGFRKLASWKPYFRLLQEIGVGVVVVQSSGHTGCASR